MENKYNKVLIRNLIICFFIFGLALIFLVKRKTKYLLYLQGEVRLMKEGVLNRPIEIYGDDELTTFARHIEEIRTPLSSLIGYLDILSSKKVEDTSKLDRYLDKSLEKTNQLKDLIDNLFAYLLESEEDYIGDTDDKTTSRDGFRELILDGLLFLESNRIKVNLTSEEETDEPLNISRINVQRLVDNVFSNALKYSYRPGYVLIHIGENKDHVTLRLRNKIKEDDGMVESHGMGLNICEDILLKNKGFLMIKSAGGCFEVELGFRKL